MADVYIDYIDSNNLVNARRGSNELSRNYEMRLNAFVPKVNSQGSRIGFPESITDFMLMAIAIFDDNRRVSILEAAVKNRPTTSEKNLVPTIKC